MRKFLVVVVTFLTALSSQIPALAMEEDREENRVLSLPSKSLKNHALEPVRVEQEITGATCPNPWVGITIIPLSSPLRLMRVCWSESSGSYKKMCEEMKKKPQGRYWLRDNLWIVPENVTYHPFWWASQGTNGKELWIVSRGEGRSSVYMLPSLKDNQEIIYMNQSSCEEMKKNPYQTYQIGSCAWKVEPEYTYHSPSSYVYALFYPGATTLIFSNLVTKKDADTWLTAKGASMPVQRVLKVEKVSK